MDTLELYAINTTTPTLFKRVVIPIYSVAAYVIGVTALPGWLHCSPGYHCRCRLRRTFTTR